MRFGEGRGDGALAAAFGELEWREALAVRDRARCAEAEERAGGFRLVRFHGDVERRIALLGLRIERRAAGDEKLDELGVPGADRVVQVFVDTDPELCKQRRPSANFDGFTAPENADVSVGLDKMRIDEAVKLIVNALAARGQF